MDNGEITVVDRKKAIIITAGGKNIAPSEIENALKDNEFIKEAIVVGEGRRFLTALLALNGEALTTWAEAHDKMASFEALADDPDLRAEIDRAIGAGFLALLDLGVSTKDRLAEANPAAGMSFVTGDVVTFCSHTHRQHVIGKP